MNEINDDILTFIEDQGLSYIEGRAVEAIINKDHGEAIWFLSKLLAPPEEEPEERGAAPVAQRWRSGDTDDGQRAYQIQGGRFLYCYEQVKGSVTVRDDDTVLAVGQPSDEQALLLLGYEVRV